MPFIPHTEFDEQEMLESLAVQTIDELFDEVPNDLRAGPLSNVPNGINEMSMLRLMNRRAARDQVDLCFLGAGAYEHHIPSAIWDLVSRGEFLTSYTPYQAEASQGTLQLIYEYQTMMAHLTAMDVANASVYDGATALAEAVLMAVRANRKSKNRHVLIAGNCNPYYKRTLKTIVANQKISLTELDWDTGSGLLRADFESRFENDDITACVIAYPNFFGGLEDVDRITDWAQERGALLIAVVNPMVLGLLRPPGDWGAGDGADIVVGDTQPFGIPLSSGGPYAGFMCCRKNIVRQMPGRIVGRTVDLDGKEGFTLTLQAREQHIRRAKATSNICTNQGLLVSATAVYLSLLGATGLNAVAKTCHENTVKLLESISRLDGAGLRFRASFFHEIVVEFEVNAEVVLGELRSRNILGGLLLEEHYPELKNCVLINVTETKTDEDIETLVDAFRQAIETHRV